MLGNWRDSVFLFGGMEMAATHKDSRFMSDDEKKRVEEIRESFAADLSEEEKGFLLSLIGSQENEIRSLESAITKLLDGLERIRVDLEHMEAAGDIKPIISDSLDAKIRELLCENGRIK
jgi:hypothetical protein